MFSEKSNVKNVQSKLLFISLLAIFVHTNGVKLNENNEEKAKQEKLVGHKPQWHVIDAEGQEADRLATKIAYTLQGKNKQTWQPNVDVGDNVVVTNIKDMIWWKREENNQGNLGQIKGADINDIPRINPAKLLAHLVKERLPKNNLRKIYMERLFVYEGEAGKQENKAKEEKLVGPRLWYIINAKDKMCNRLAYVIANILQGKTKPTWHPEADVGDYVVVENIKGMTWGKRDKHNTGNLGKVKEKTNAISRIHPTALLASVVKEKLPKNDLREIYMSRLYLYVGEAPKKGNSGWDASPPVLEKGGDEYM